MRIEKAALMLPLSTKATVEENTNTCSDRRCTTEDHNVFKKFWIHASRHIIINTDGEGDSKDSTGKGLLTYTATIATNSEHETDMAVVTRCPVSLEYSTSSVLHCW